MNMEYLGPSVRRGIFMCRRTKVEEFIIGNDAIEELDAYLHEYKMPTALARAFDP